MQSSELFQGDLVKLSNGWLAELIEDPRGKMCSARVFGLDTEVGSVYISDIREVRLDDYQMGYYWEEVYE